MTDRKTNNSNLTMLPCKCNLNEAKGLGWDLTTEGLKNGVTEKSYLLAPVTCIKYHITIALLDLNFSRFNIHTNDLFISLLSQLA